MTENDYDMQVVSISHARKSLCSFALNRGADKPLARPGRKQATATKDSDCHISYLQS